MVEFIKYYLGIFWFALTGAWKTSDSIGTIFAFIAGYIKLKHSDWGPKMENPMWMTIATIFAALFFVRLILAPYEKHKKQQQDLADFKLKLDAEREKLKQRLEPFIREIANLIRDVSRNNTNFLQKKAEKFLTQKWLNDAKISEDDQYKYFHNCLCPDFELARKCYALLYIEDWIDNSELFYIFRNARTFFLGGIKQMGKTIKFTFKYYSFVDVLAMTLPHL